MDEFYVVCVLMWDMDNAKNPYDLDGRELIDDIDILVTESFDDARIFYDTLVENYPTPLLNSNRLHWMRFEFCLEKCRQAGDSRECIDLIEQDELDINTHTSVKV